jgi:hypothetical protein
MQAKQRLAGVALGIRVHKGLGLDSGLMASSHYVVAFVISQ